MKVRNYMLYGVLIVVLAGLTFAIVQILEDDKVTGLVNQEKSNSAAFETISTGSTSTGEVFIELTPRIEDGQLVVDISTNTHSVSLDEFDLEEITTLEYNGKTVKPLSAPSLGGHHSNGELVFEVDENIDSFTIKIKGIPKVEERIFNW